MSTYSLSLVAVIYKFWYLELTNNHNFMYF